MSFSYSSVDDMDTKQCWPLTSRVAEPIDGPSYLVDGMNLWHERVATFLRAKNAQSRINQLPVEVLSEIFLFCHSSDDFKWMSITKVCHLWREIALHFSRLWNRINVCDARAGKHFLTRTKDTALHLKSRKGSFAEISLLNECMQQMHRVASVNFEGLSSQTLSGVLPVPPCVSPLLLFCADVGRDFLASFEDCEFPVIRILSIMCPRNETIPSCFFGSTLAYLALNRPTLDFPHFLDTLSNMSHLMYLHLYKVSLLPFSGTNSNKSLSRIALPRLRSLKVLSDVSGLSCDLHLELLSRIDIPPDAQANIRFDSSNEGEGLEDAPGYLSLLTVFRQVAKRSLLIKLTSSRRLIGFWPTKIDLLSMAKPPCRIILPSGLENPTAVLDLFERVPVDDIESLDLQPFNPSPDYAIEWERIFKGYTRVKDVMLGDGSFRYFVRGIQKDLFDCSTDGIQFMPSLETIYIHFDPEDNGQRIPPMQEFIDAMVARQRHGHPIKAVYFTGTQELSSGDIGQLKETVPTVARASRILDWSKVQPS